MTHPTAPAALPPGVDVGTVAADLAADGVAVPAGTDPAALVAAVARVRADDGLGLSVVVLPGDVSQDAAADLAKALRDRGEDTVLVLSRTGVGASSSRYSTDEVTGAIQAATSTPDDAAAATAFADELTATGPPWGWIVAGAVLVAALLAVGGRWWERRRRRVRDATALHAEGERLRGRVAAMGERIVRYEPQIPVHDGQHPDAPLDPEFDTLSAGYRDLVDAVAADPPHRAAADALDGRVTAAEQRLDAVAVALGEPTTSR